MPSFERVLKGQARFRWSFLRSGWGLRVAFVCCLIVLVGSAVISRLYQPAEAELETYSLLSEWESPTDFLMELSDDSLMSAVPEIDLEVDWMENDTEATEEKDPSAISVVLPGGGNHEEYA